MLEMNFNNKEIESFIKLYYKEFKNIKVNVSLDNNGAIVSGEDEKIRLSSNEISFVISEYFGSQNMGIRSMNGSNNKENDTIIKVAQLNRGTVRKLV